MLIRVALGLGLFLGSLALGWWLHRLGFLTEARAARIVRCVVIGTSPVVLCLLFWRLDLYRFELWVLPLIGLAISSATLLPAVLYARSARLSRPETGSFLTCAFFSNVGYLGAFTAYALFGEIAYGLCIVYLVFFDPCFYTLGFWVASRYGRPSAAAASARPVDGGLRFYPFMGILVGCALSLAHVPRPMPLVWLNQALIPANTACYLMAAGSQLTINSPRPWLRSCLAMSGIKFLYAPLIAWGLVHLARLEGLPRLVVLLEASTPVAVSPLVLPLLFGLDRKLSNALWLSTTVIAIPWLLLIVPLLQHL